MIQSRINKQKEEVIIILNMHIPSVNDMYALRRGRRVISYQHKQYKQAIYEELKIKIRGVFYNKNDKINMIIKVSFARRGRDIDNILKPLLDAMQGVIYDNDKQIYSILIIRNDKTKKDKIVIKISKK